MAQQRRSRSPEIPNYDEVGPAMREYYFSIHEADVEEQLVEHEAPACNQLLQEFWDFFRGAAEIRNLMYGFIFEDSALSLIVEESEYHGPAVRFYVGAKTGTRIPYRYLLEPDYFIDNAEIRKEMADMWFRTSKFGVQDPSTIASSLLQFPWGAGLKPLTTLRHVLVVAYTRYNPDDEPHELERSLKPLLLLNTKAAITIYVENLIHYPDFEDAEVVVSMRTCAQRAAYLFPELVELRSRGYKVTVRSEFGLEFLVEPEETTVEGWTKICEAAVEEARIKLWKAEYSEDFGDWDKMEEASQKYISDSSQHYCSDDPQEEDSDESHEDGSDASQEDESDASQEDESDESQE
ncbi:hypothetical protein J4E86_005845 [Alternaria arbusti]|uniref:uncharacterized protein n=1 Tax=Alternaria arbusti TaxID=232088 RepID=UPI00221F1328|nr:uncharacterized protein J4E86_005845 [Alternaria arbusti]KAI4954536.1 hypothetical protein J4E86_005845 [Alternaria arbusti]